MKSRNWIGRNSLPLLAGLAPLIAAAAPQIPVGTPGQGPEGRMHGPAQERGPATGPAFRQGRDMEAGARPHPDQGFRAGGPQGQRPPLDPERLKAAGATKEQIEAMEALNFELQAQRIDLQATADKAELALDRLMKTQEPEEADVVKAADALSAARSALFRMDLISELRVRKTLGGELLGKLRELGPGPRGMGHRMSGPQGDQPEGAPEMPPPPDVPDAEREPQPDVRP